MNDKTVTHLPIGTALSLLEEEVNKHNLYILKEAAETLSKLSTFCDSLADLGALIDGLSITQEQYDQLKAPYEKTLNEVNKWVAEETKKSKKASLQLELNQNHEVVRADNLNNIQ